MKFYFGKTLICFLLLACCAGSFSGIVDNRKLTRSKRISSGLVAKATGFGDYVVSIRSRVPEAFFGDNHFCMGTIISAHHVITVAHCVMDKAKILQKPHNLLLFATVSNRVKLTPNTRHFPVDRIHVKNNFTIENTCDVALLAVLKSMPIGAPGIRSLPLPTADPPFGKVCSVCGMGRHFKLGPISSILLYVNVTLFPNEKCKSLLKTFMPEMLCAGNLNNKIDENPCGGDLGAPLICANTLVGMASYLIGCGTINLPTVYTNVHYHLSWIKSILNGSLHVKCNLLLLAITFLIIDFFNMLSLFLNTMLSHIFTSYNK